MVYKHIVLVIHCSPKLQHHLETAFTNLIHKYYTVCKRRGIAYKFLPTRGVLEDGLTNLMHMHYMIIERRATAYKFLHTHSVLLRLPLTTADEKLSKVTAPW